MKDLTINKVNLTKEELKKLSNSELLGLYKEVSDFIAYLDQCILPLDEEEAENE